MKPNFVYAVEIDEVDELFGHQHNLHLFYMVEDARKKFSDIVSSFKEDIEDWDKEPYEFEESEDSFEWWEEGRYLENRYVATLTKKNIA